MNQNQDASPNREQEKPDHSISPDEMRVIKECMDEAFFYRCVPFSLILGGSALILQRQGILSKSAKWGYGPKVMFGGFMGYIMGKWSYTSICSEKILARLPDSSLAEAIRKRRGISSNFSVDSALMNTTGSFEKDRAEPSAPIFYEDRSDIRQQEGIDSYDTVTETLSPYTEQQNTERKPTNSNSYDELRQKNRDEFASKNRSRFAKPYPDQNSNDYRKEFGIVETPREAPPPESYKKRNKYGDIIDD